MHHQTRETAIPAAVKKAVYARDGGLCILCGRQGNPWCHYVSRARGGLGIEENIVTLCSPCHERFDHAAARAALREVVASYLKGKYPNWDETKLIYKKGQ